MMAIRRLMQKLFPGRPDFWLPSYQNPDLPHLTRRGM
jgi:hypothetical protein